MTKQNIKLKIHRDQLKWFLAILLNERDIFQLLMHTNLVADPDKLYSSSKQELLNRLTTAFLKQSNIDDIVVEQLSQKAKGAISRVGYMVVDEIHTFFKSPGPLIESGEFGEVVWALLTDSREDVHLHGFNLLTAGYETHREPNEGFVQPHSASDTTFSQIPSPEAQDTQAEYTRDLEESQAEFDSQKAEFERLERVFADLKTQYTTIEKKNTQLEQHCQILTEENEALKNKENDYQENEKQIIFLQQENDSLHEKATQYAETNVSLMRLEEEYQQLLTENQEISAQLNELSQIKVAKETFTVELKLVEEAIYKEYQALEQLKNDLQNHFDMIERSTEVSRSALNQIRQTVNHIDEPRLDIPENSDKAITQPRVGVFVDVQNMFYAAKDRFERRVDYIKLLDLIVGPRQLMSAYAYIVQIPEINQSNFLSLLEHNGYTIRSKDLRLRGDGSAKGDWDVGIAVDVVSMLGTLDVVILASGDGDFCPLAELIKQQHKRIEVVAFEHNTSMDLQAMADQFFPIGEELLM
jgi:uncharacterized LabA/DUF88 family protein/predicted  nucleic acid-binding Zn-ribbon protein